MHARGVHIGTGLLIMTFVEREGLFLKPIIIFQLTVKNRSIHIYIYTRTVVWNYRLSRASDL